MAVSIQVAEFVNILTETFLYGTYSILICVTLSILVSRRKARPVNPLLVAITVLMYALSTGHFLAIAVSAFRAFVRQDDTAFENQGNMPNIIAGYLEVINIMCADLILIWRVWAVWGKRYAPVIVPLCSFLASAVSGILYAHSYQIALPGVSLLVQNRVVAFARPAALTVLLTNLMCTGLIAGRIWFMQRRLSKAFPAKSAVYRRVILVVLESGGIYSAAWIALLVLGAIPSNALYIVYGMIGQLNGIVPTSIILLARTDMMVGSEVEQQYTDSAATVQFRSRDRTLQGVESVIDISIKMEAGTAESTRVGTRSAFGTSGPRTWGPMFDSDAASALEGRG